MEITSAEFLGSWDILTNGDMTKTGIVSEIGKKYFIRISGTFRIGGPGDGLADAEFADFSNPPYSLLDYTDDGDDLGVTVNGVKPRYGAYSPSHIYTYSFTGDGSIIRFAYFDIGYGYNFGTLKVELFDTDPSDDPPASTTVTIKQAVQIAWTSQKGKSYSVEWSPTMEANSWKRVFGPVGGTGEEMTYVHLTDEHGKGFFRVVDQ